MTQSREYRALHEAGHAIVGEMLGAPIVYATIDPAEEEEADYVGAAFNLYPTPEQLLGAEDWCYLLQAVVLLSGHVATEKAGYQTPNSDRGLSLDYASADEMLGKISIGRELRPAAEAMAELIVTLAWSRIKAFAQELEEKGSYGTAPPKT
ncbi:MAG: hypothetical protein AAGI11_04370 [Pseudomonadota bacterium]